MTFSFTFPSHLAEPCDFGRVNQGSTPDLVSRAGITKYFPVFRPSGQPQNGCSILIPSKLVTHQNGRVGKVAWIGNPLGQGVMGGVLLGTFLPLLINLTGSDLNVCFIHGPQGGAHGCAEYKKYLARGCDYPLPLRLQINTKI